MQLSSSSGCFIDYDVCIYIILTWPYQFTQQLAFATCLAKLCYIIVSVILNHS